MRVPNIIKATMEDTWSIRTMLASKLESYHATNMANMWSRESMDKTAANRVSSQPRFVAEPDNSAFSAPSRAGNI